MSVETYYESLVALYKLQAKSSTYFNDGNYNSPRAPIKFPVYAWNKETFPFVFNRSLYYGIGCSLPTDEFAPCDEPEKYEKNLREQPENWKYRTKKIQYNVNSGGYRTNEWQDIDWKNSTVIFGCSCVYGIGVAEDETISYLLEKDTNSPVINMGFPGGSNEHILENIINLLQFVGSNNIPKNIVIGWTTTDRFMYYTGEDIYSIGPWSIMNSDNSRLGQKFKQGYISMFEEKHNEMMRAYNIGRTVRELLKYKTNLVEFSYFPESAHYIRMKQPAFGMIDTGRDRLHPGAESHKLVADYLKEQINV